MRVKCLSQEHNTMFLARNPETSALRPQRLPLGVNTVCIFIATLASTSLKLIQGQHLLTNVSAFDSFYWLILAFSN